LKGGGEETSKWGWDRLLNCDWKGSSYAGKGKEFQNFTTRIRASKGISLAARIGKPNGSFGTVDLAGTNNERVPMQGGMK